MITHGSNLKEARSLEDINDTVVVVRLLKLSTRSTDIIQVSRLETATAEIMKNIPLGSKSAKYSYAQ